MKNPEVPAIVRVDLTGDSVLVTFVDGETVPFPTRLLHAARDVARAIAEKELAERSAGSLEMTG